jgi:outer membrane protein TolC
MKAVIIAFFVLMATAPGSVCAQAPGGADGMTKLAALFVPHPGSEASGPALTLADVERIALAENPEIVVAARRVAVAESSVSAAGALDDPSAMYRGWAVPLNQPWNYNDAQNMFSIGRTFQARSKRTLRTEVAKSDVDVARAQLAQVRLEIQVRVHKAFDDMLLAQDELRIHDQHVGIARQAIEAARIKYAVGKVSQQDILKAQVRLTALAEHMIRFDRDADLAKSRLNTLLGRDPEAPLNVSGEYAAMVALPAAQALEDRALQSRPDLAGARIAAARSEQEQALARKAFVPDLTLSGGYMLMPPGSTARNNYMVEGSMNLPWLNRSKHNAEIAEATAARTEQDADLQALRNAAFGQIEDALVEARASQRLVHMYQDQLRPQAEATLQASVIAYKNDKTDFLDLLDSQMEVVDVDLARFQAIAEFDARMADLELATGNSLDQQPQTSPEVKP